MPTAWNRTPEEFHKIYVANTDAFYRVGSISLAEELDKFMTSCALGLWSKAGSIKFSDVVKGGSMELTMSKKP